MGWIPSDDYDYQNTTTTMEFEWGANDEYYVDAAIQWKFDGFDGIGEYEYWGSKGYDQGSPNWEIDEVTFTVLNEDGDEVTLPDDQWQAIHQHICSNAEPDFD